MPFVALQNALHLSRLRLKTKRLANLFAEAKVLQGILGKS